MKPLNCKLSNICYMRCINKDDLSYVDVPLPVGATSEFRNKLLKIADELCGDYFVRSDSKPKEYHYYYLHEVREPYLNEIISNLSTGQELDILDGNAITVNKETFEIKNRYKLP